MLRTCVLVSGGGTNLQAILDRIADGRLAGVSVVRVISSDPEAYALTRAAAAGVEGVCVAPRAFASRAEHDEALLAAIDEAAPDLIVLAGYLVRVPVNVIARYRGRIINIHPALIPSFCGKGFYGLRVHEAALERGVKLTGATVHFVDEDMDTGPIILQRAVEVMDGDTPEILQRRVMEQAEWEILPQAIALIAAGRVATEGRSVRILPEEGSE